MSVYVDNARIPYGRMLMSHMMADTEEELHEMAFAIGVARKWYQGDHYDVCATMRTKAIARGALPTNSLRLVALRRDRRRSAP